MDIIKICNKIQDRFATSMSSKNENGKMRVEAIILITVFLFLISFYFFENVFQKTDGLFRIASIGIVFTGFIMVVLYFRLLISETDKKNKKALMNKNNDLLNYKRTIEDDFRSLFIDDSYFMKFKERAIDSKLIDKDYKWLFKEKETLYFALLFYKLKENNYFKTKIENKFFCEVSNGLMGTKIDPSMLSKYNPDKENNRHIKADHLKYYSEEYSIFDII